MMDKRFGEIGNCRLDNFLLKEEKNTPFLSFYNLIISVNIITGNEKYFYEYPCNAKLLKLYIYI